MSVGLINRAIEGVQENQGNPFYDHQWIECQNAAENLLNVLSEAVTKGETQLTPSQLAQVKADAKSLQNLVKQLPDNGLAFLCKNILSDICDPILNSHPTLQG